MGSTLSWIADEQDKEYRQSEKYKTKEKNKVLYKELMKEIEKYPIKNLTLCQLNFLQEGIISRPYTRYDTLEEEFYTDKRIEKLRSILVTITRSY